MEQKVYKSKFGWTVMLFMFVVFALVFWLSYTSENDSSKSVLLALILLGTLAFFAWISLSTRYSISATEIHIRCLPFYRNKTIAIETIKKVAVSRNMISSPAPSLDRIEIYFGTYDSMVISPKNKLQFMDDLKQVNPSIQLIKTC